MTRLEAIIYAIGRLDQMPKTGIRSRVMLSECHQCFDPGYQISRVNLFDCDSLYLGIGDPEKNEMDTVILNVIRDSVTIHEAAVLIDTAYGMCSKRHKKNK